MEKLDKVIRALECCIVTDCENCDSGGRNCVERLMMEALDVVKELSADNQRLGDMWADTTKKLSVTRAERDAAREKLARVIGERESAWVELGEKPMPNDWGEYPPEFPREGM